MSTIPASPIIPEPATQPVRRAVILAAGLGTRLQPITRVVPKEMLPIGRKPVLEHILDEVCAAGVTDLLFVISREKALIGEYFGDGSNWGVRCATVIQPAMRGIADAVLRAEEWTCGDPFLLAFGDCMLTGPGDGPTRRLLAAHRAAGAAATALCEEVPLARTRHYGILVPDPDSEWAEGAPFRLSGMVEKPEPERSPSRWAVAARWALDRRVFPYLRCLQPAANGETNLYQAVPTMISDGLPVWAAPLLRGEARRDTGRWKSYLVCAARAAAEDEEAGAEAVAAAVAARPAEGG